ncbi:structural maintenance of chromosomes protein 2-1-like [Cryptosporidium felis]|nr:structural maintenance of chromosomes protein 2-1-like [Cryptosporidium felis]
MYIEEIILDGFKSYQKRTVIGKFDPKFNAITGLNGSGKSNILDSICFVLGINNLSQIRINKLEELVYKSGQAGVSKASVSIVFNNYDKSKSSPLYKDLDKITITRQIATGGRNRYLLNGSVAKPIEITNFFHSVQLNVNNSHFLIMQGRITKVINMKPKELLSMVEEAAGTRMYETKKQQSLKLIEKKDIKLGEINRMLEEDIIPKLERLKKERVDYLKWASINEETELFERMCTLHGFNNLNLEINQAEDKLNNAKSFLDEIEREILINKDIIVTLKNFVEEEERKLSSEWSTPLKNCKEKISNVESKVSLTQVHLNELRIDLKDEESSLNEYYNQKKNIEEQLNYPDIDLCSETMRKQSEEFVRIKERIDDLKNKVEVCNTSLQGIRTGCDININHSEQKSLRQSLYETERELTNISVQEKKLKMKIEEIEQKIKPLNIQAKKDKNMKNKQKQSDQEYYKLRDEIDRLEKSIVDLKEDAELCEKYNIERKRLKIENDSLEMQIQPIEMFIRTRQCIYDAGNQRELAIQVQINCVDSISNFSKAIKTKVKGSVFELIDFSDNRYSTALEMTAGGRLYNLVVESHEVGKRLLTSGLVKKRTTIIPLDKITDPSIPENVVSSARRLISCKEGDLRVVSAMKVIKFDEELNSAMKYCFGHTLICEDDKIAKCITFHPEIAVRTVTLNGDIYDPSGTLTGGSLQVSQNRILTSYKQYNELRCRILNNNKRIEEIDSEISKGLGKAAETYRCFQTQLEISKHQFKLLEDRITKLQEDSAELKLEKYLNDIETLKKEYKQIIFNEDSLKKNKLRLNNEIKLFETNKDYRERQLEEDIKKYKLELKELSITYKDLEKATSSTRIENQVLKAELAQLTELIDKKTGIVNEIKKNIELQNAQLLDFQCELKKSKDSLIIFQQEIESSNEAIKEKKTEIKAIEKNISKKQIELTKAIHEVQTVNTYLLNKKKIKDSMIKKLEWLQDQNYVNQFDLGTYSQKTCIKKLEDLQLEQKLLSKNVNRKILNLYERASIECEELINKRDIVTKDKDKIEDVISDLDQKKKQALENTWKTVNSSFKSIFSTLLPNSTAELVPSINPETNIESFYEGLEFKVELGGVWKKSLSELSGGQRSLLALSLILSLLRFKPAPVYILDEIDSALDLGHTQNIGKMIKNHFPDSQFLIVSLKEGMFNKADVLFKTELIHGVSTVTRLENRPKELTDENTNTNTVVVSNNKVRKKNA